MIFFSLCSLIRNITFLASPTAKIYYIYPLQHWSILYLKASNNKCVLDHYFQHFAHTHCVTDHRRSTANNKYSIIQCICSIFSLTAIFPCYTILAPPSSSSSPNNNKLIEDEPYLIFDGYRTPVLMETR